MSEMRIHLVEEEIRDSFAAGVEVRGGDADQPAVLGGYAAVFGQETIIQSNTGLQWRERIAPTAFSEAIGRDDVIAAPNHDHRQVLGRTKNGTLALKVDAHGLHYTVTLPNTTVARDTVESVRRGDYSGSSFKFIVPKGGARIAKEAGVGPDDLPLLIIERVKLIDVGPVTFPAYEGTSVSARSVPEIVSTFYREQEAVAREAEAAKTPASRALEAALAQIQAARAQVV